MICDFPTPGGPHNITKVADRHQVPVIDIRLSQMEPSDLRGIPFRHDNLVDWSVPSLLPNAERHGPAGVLFLDEINSAPPTVSAAAYQRILDRRLGDYHVPDGWAIFAAGNRQGDRGVTYTMPAPLANRFSHFEVDVNLDDWAHWAYTHDMDERLIAFLRFKPELLFDFDPAHNPVAFPSPRSWEFSDRALQKFAHHGHLLTQSLQACVGDAAGIELAAFVENLDNLPNIDDILAGKPVPMPKATDLQYAVASALISRAIKASQGKNAKETYGRILDYAGKFRHREMGIMLVSDLHRVIGQDLFSVPEFAPWAQKVGEVMLYSD